MESDTGPLGSAEWDAGEQPGQACSAFTDSVFTKS